MKFKKMAASGALAIATSAMMVTAAFAYVGQVVQTHPGQTTCDANACTSVYVLVVIIGYDSSGRPLHGLQVVYVVIPKRPGSIQYN